MKNPFSKKKKNLPIPIGLPSSINPTYLPIGSNNNLIGVMGSISINGVSSTAPIGSMGSMSVNGISWAAASASTWTVISPEEQLKKRKKELSDEFEKNPELFSEIIVELRRRKIKKIKENIE